MINSGAVTTLAGSPGNSGSSDGVGSAALFSSPVGLVSDGAGSLYVTDSGNQTVRQVVIATGSVTTVAGSVGVAGATDGTGGAARFRTPSGLTRDDGGNLHLADTLNHTIRKLVPSTGAETTLAGSAGNPGSTDGTGTAAQFSQPTGLTADGSGNLFVADTNNSVVASWS